MDAMQTAVLDMLIGGLWHTTSEERYRGIVECGSILVEPDIPASERWGAELGPERYPYVRTLGGVSLFDFNNFDPDGYAKICPSSNWQEFVPICKKWPSAVWIEIDRDAVKERLVSGCELLKRWKKEGAEWHRVMPYIESAYIGELSTACFIRSFLVNANGIECMD